MRQNLGKNKHEKATEFRQKSTKLLEIAAKWDAINVKSQMVQTSVYFCLDLPLCFGGLLSFPINLKEKLWSPLIDPWAREISAQRDCKTF